MLCGSLTSIIPAFCPAAFCTAALCTAAFCAAAFCTAAYKMSLIDEVSWPSSTTGSNIGDRYIGSEPLSTLLEFEFEPTLTTKAATTTATEEHPIHGTPKAPSTDKGRKRASDEPFRTVRIYWSR